MARETERLTIGWGIISPYTRHPVQVAMDARVVQEAAGPGRFIVGFGTSKIFLNNAQQAAERSRSGRCATRSRSCAASSAVSASSTTARSLGADVPALVGRAHAPRWTCRRLRRRHGADDAAARRRDRRRLPDAVDHDARLRPLHAAARSRRAQPDVDLGCTIVASIHETDRDRGPRRRARDRRHVPRQQGAEHPGLRRRAARARRHRAGGDPARSPRRWSRAAGSPRRRR